MLIQTGKVRTNKTVQKALKTDSQKSVKPGMLAAKLRVQAKKPTSPRI